MSLLVDVYRQNATGEMELLGPNDLVEEQAGLEAYRGTIYGGRVARLLNLRLLPLLAERDLHVEGDELATLKSEADLVLANIGMFANQVCADVDSLRSHLKNILAAIRRAQQEGGGVLIW